jgi:acetylornithine deacetylase/succinyl-diaminopimelate desuccinylase family protein
LKKTIGRHVRALRRDMLAFTKDLIKIRTENPPGTYYKECVELIVDKLEQFSLRSKIIKVKGDVPGHPRYSIVSSYGSGDRVVHFHGHYDVVPAAGAHQYKPVVRNNRLFGRGAADMKSGLSVMIYAVRVLQLMGIEIPGRICLVIVPDEETGGMHGTRHLFEQGYIKKKDSIGMLMAEPTSGAIWNACRGALSLMIGVKGRAVHVVLQQKGINAFEAMNELVKELRKMKYAVEKRRTRYAVARGESEHSVLMLGGVCRCGTNFNVVPGECSFSVERRINPEENIDQEKRRLMNLIRSFRKKGVSISARVLQEGEAAGCPVDSVLAQSLVSSIRAVSGKRPQFLMCPGLLEIRYYMKNGIPAYAYGPGSIQRAHHPVEFVSVKRMAECTTIYALTAAEALASGGMR